MSITVLRLEKAIHLLSARKAGIGWWVYTMTDGTEGECATKDLVELGTLMGVWGNESEALAEWLVG